MLTFDDGYYNNYLNAYPLLQKYQMKAVISIIVGETDKYSELDENKENYSHITWDMINEMMESGLIEIQNHTYNLHKTGNPRRGAAQRKDETTEQYFAAVGADLQKAQDRIEEMTGWRPNTFTYPFGSYSRHSQELLEQLSAPADKLQYRAPLSGNVQLLSESITEEQLLLDFSEEYYRQPVTTEVLTRAAIVRTLSQIDGVAHISFQVKEEPLTDTYGNVIGVMNADMFIDNDGNEINTYEKAKLLLYFANEDGTRLCAVKRNVVYSSNISMERLVVEQLLLGPQKNEAGYAVLNPSTKILSVTVKDGTCYVNLDTSFWTKSYNVSSDVMIYSIVNSLTELSSVNRVQITIDTEGAVDLKDHASLQPSYERNLDLVE